MATSSDKEGAGTEGPPPLDDFTERLDRMRGEHDPGEEKKSGAGSGAAWGRALRASSDLLAGLFVGTLLGFLLDRWLGTSPWLLLVGIGIGFAAGLRNLARSIK
jgi:ATP synthase protein I